MNASSIDKTMKPVLTALFTALIVSACVTAPPQPSEIIPPEPIQGNSGKFMCPYTTDGVVAEWVDKAINARAAAGIGSAAGSYIGSKALSQVPFIGGFLGDKAGAEIGRKMAIQASGGEEYIKKTSDLSFNSIDDLAVWLYAVHSTDKEHYDDVFKATCGIYPDLETRYMDAIQNAKRKG
jgi:hypothetical protein